MPSNTARFIFVALCAAGFLSICAGIIFESGRLKRGDSALSKRQLRWRLVGGALWLLVLGSLFYATLFQWPGGPGDKETARRFAAIVLGAMALLMLALVLTAGDIYLTLVAAKLQRQKFERNANEMARLELERVRAQADQTQKENRDD